MQVFYHLGELNDALSYALGAGSLFDVEEGSEYANTLLCKCMPCAPVEEENACMGAPSSTMLPSAGA